jgi:hypothetical protein
MLIAADGAARRREIAPLCLGSTCADPGAASHLVTDASFAAKNRNAIAVKAKPTFTEPDRRSTEPH